MVHPRTITSALAPRGRAEGRASERPRAAVCLDLGLRGLPVDELAARRFVALRGALWRSLLAHLPAVEPICALARDTLAPGLRPEPALARLSAAARALRECDTPGARAACDAAREAAALQLGPADPDGLLCDRLLADLTELELGRDAAVVPIRLSRDVLRFSHYVTMARHNYDAVHAVRAAALAGVGPLAAVVAARATGGPSGPALDAAEDALRRALGRFHPRRGLAFATCAAWWIDRALARAGGRVHLPPDPSVAARSARRLVQEFIAVHGRPPCADERALLDALPDAATHSDSPRLGLA